MLLLTVLCGAMAGAQAISLFPEAGTHVYQWPADWRLPGLADGQIASIEADIEGRHFPFYVVLVSGEALPGQGDGQERLQVATDGLMTAWIEQGVDLSQAVVFSVAWGADCDKHPADRRPGTVCEYFLNAGPTLIHGPAQFLPSRDHAPHTDLFRSAVSMTPQAPAAGILALVASVDDLLWQRTDPEVRLHSARATLQQAVFYRQQLLPQVPVEEQGTAQAGLSRAERTLAAGSLDEVIRLADALQAENTRLTLVISQYEATRRRLDLQVAQLRRAVAEGRLGADVSGPLLAEAEAAQARPSLFALERATLRLAPPLAVLEAKQVAVRYAAVQRQLGELGVLAGLVLLALSGMVALAWRREVALRARQHYAEAQAPLVERLDRALGRYSQLSLEEVLPLPDTALTTRREQQAIQAELDSTYTALSGLEAHIRQQDARVAGAGPLAATPVQDALTSLLGSAGAPGDLLSAQEARLQAVQVRQARIQAAAALRLQPAATLLPPAALLTLKKRALRRGIPQHWLCDHPLAEDGALAALDALRKDDPLAYLTALEEYSAREADITQRLDALEAALSALEAARRPSAAAPEDMVIPPADDPSLLATHARHQEAEARHLLRTATRQRDPLPVIAALDAARGAWQACSDRLDEIRHARAAEAELLAARVAWGEAEQAILDQEAPCAQAEASFQQAPQGRTLLAEAREALHTVAQICQQAEDLLAARRLLEAHRRLQGVLSLLPLARQKAADAQALFGRLAAQKATYAQKLAQLPAHRARIAQLLQEVEESHPDKLPSAEVPPLAEPADYAAACDRLDALTAAWEAALEQARKRAHASAPRHAGHRPRSSHKASSFSFSRGSTSRSSSSRSTSSGGGGSFGGSRRSSGGGGGFGGKRRSSGGGGRF